jgi:hypothetical protein
MGSLGVISGSSFIDSAGAIGKLCRTDFLAASPSEWQRRLAIINEASCKV